MAVQYQFKNPQGPGNQQLHKWAQDLTTELRKDPGRSIIYAATAGNRSFALVPSDSSASTKAANTSSIQAAIDYAYANQLQVINISPGSFWCNPGIYLDAPGNLRVSLATPTIFNFSLHLRGAGGLFNNN